MSLIIVAVGWLPNLSIKALDASGLLSSLNWYELQWCCLESGGWHSGRYQSTGTGTLNLEAHLPPVIYSGFQS